MPKKKGGGATAVASEAEKKQLAQAVEENEAKAVERKNILDYVEAEPFDLEAIVGKDWSPDNPAVAYVELTPGQCRWLIEKRCDRNRPVRANSVTEYSDRMLLGSFEAFTGNVLAFARFPDGIISLVNGQHQCRGAWLAAARMIANPAYADSDEVAITLQNFKLKFVLVAGIDPDGVQLLDHGVQRTHTDVIAATDMFSNVTDPAEKKKLNSWYPTAAKIVFFRAQYGESVRCPRKFQFHELTEIQQDENFAYLKTACLELMKHVKDRPDIVSPQKGFNGNYLVATAFAVYLAAGEAKANEFLQAVRDYVVGGDEVVAEREKGNGLYRALERYGAKNGRQSVLDNDQKLSCLMAGADAFLKGTTYDKPSAVKTPVPHPSLGGNDELGGFKLRWLDKIDNHVLTPEEIEQRKLPAAELPKGFNPKEAKGRKARFIMTHEDSVLERY